MRRTITVHDFEDDMAAGHKDANFSQGWGIAALVVAMVVAAFVIAGTINARTYLPPTDPMAPSKARAEHAPAADHAAPAGEKGAAH